MADYPDTIFETRETENLPGLVFNADQKTVLFSEDYQNLAAEITAIETVLGALVNGDFNTVLEWLEDLEAGIPANGELVPAGGTTAQILAKASDSDGDTEWVDAEGGGGGSSKKFILSTLFETIGRMSSSDYLGTSTIGIGGLVQTTTSANDSYSKIGPAIGGAGTGTLLRTGLVFSYQGYLTGNGSGYDSFIGLGSPTFNDGGLSANSARIGFYIKRRSSGDIQLYASCATGSAKTETLLTTLTIDQSFDLSLEYKGSSVDFYWAKNDGALSSATNISTNLPTSGISRVTIGISNASLGTTAMALYSGFMSIQY